MRHYFVELLVDALKLFITKAQPRFKQSQLVGQVDPNSNQPPDKTQGGDDKAKDGEKSIGVHYSAFRKRDGFRVGG